MTFSINALNIKYRVTNRGVNAKANILFDGIAVGYIDDIAEAITTTVKFKRPENRDEFLKDSYEWKRELSINGDDYRISEYARYLMAKSEQDYLERTK